MSPFDDPWLSSRPSSPNTRAVHISRILDPSYSSPSSSPHSPTVYIDNHGDIHDPDYRDFPPLLPAKRPYSSRTATPCHSLAAAFHSTRPAWECPDLFDDTLSDRDDDDEEEEDPCCDSRSRLSRRSSIRSRSHHHHRHHYHPRDYRQTFSTYAYSSSEPSPPTSLDSPNFPDESDLFAHNDREKLRKSPRVKPQRKLSPTPQAQLLAPHALPEEDEPREHEDDDDDRDDGCHPEWTPTCTEAMRRQWQAISLRFKFGLFRAQRELRRRIMRR
jgi:hypothetical protein